MKHVAKMNNDDSVVYRLRLTFASVILILLISGLSSGVLLSNLKASQRNAIENSVPTLSQSHELASQLVSITDLTIRLGRVTHSQEVKDIRTELISRNIRLRRILDADLLKSDGNEIDVGELVNSAQYLTDSVEGVVNSKLKMIEMVEAIHTKLAQTKSIQSALNDQIKPLSLSLANAVNVSLDSIASKPTSIDLVESNLANDIHDQHQLHKISFELSTLMDLIETSQSSYEQADQTVLRAGFETRFKSIAKILFSFTELNNRPAWAVLVKGLRDLTLGETGLLNNLATQQSYADQFKSIHHEQLKQIKSFSDRIDAIVLDTKKDIQSSTVEFNRILNEIILTFALFGCGVVGIITLVNHVVIERQINRRMQRLTSAVLDIANGDHNRDVDVTGDDEIGTMASSLEVFKQNAFELQRSNEELEQFAYAASHDLKSPLRAIESLATWTLEDSGDTLAPEAKSNLEQLLIRANRLSRLQTDLLNYSRAGKPDQSVKPIDFTDMVGDLAEMLDPDHHFTIRLGRAPTGLCTQVVPLRQIVLNLITNAMKHNDLDSGIIQVDIDVVRNRLQISVSDNGPGIAAEYHERIFGLFEKLESRDKVEGSGLGLSLVKKMVERCNGSIAVISDPTKNRGSTFVFDWPFTDSSNIAASTVEPYVEPHKNVVGF